MAKYDALALRAYLQRGEVRLSTMHRVAGAFLSGAGLLLLLPVFAQDALNDLAIAGADVWPALAARPNADLWVCVYALPILAAFAIPLYASGACSAI